MIPCRPFPGGLALLLTAGFILAPEARLSVHHELAHRTVAAERRQINTHMQNFSLRAQCEINFSFTLLRATLSPAAFVYS